MSWLVWTQQTMDIWRRGAGMWPAMLLVCACGQSDPPVTASPGGDGDGDGGNGADSGTVEPGGDGDADAAMLDGVTTAEHTYPLVPDSRWVYAHRGGDEPWDEEVRLLAEDHDGESVLVLRDTPGPSGSRTESVLREVGTAALRVSKQVFVGDTLLTRAEYDPGFTRHDLTWAQREAGYSETRDYMRLEWDAAGQLVRMGERAHTFTIEDTAASVSVPAGDFEGCLRIHRVRERGAGVPLDEEDDKRYWYCPGVGKVREVEDATGKTEELLECQIPGGACP